MIQTQNLIERAICSAQSFLSQPTSLRWTLSAIPLTSRLFIALYNLGQFCCSISIFNLHSYDYKRKQI